MTSPYSYRWQRKREQFLREHPLCRRHELLGEVVAATIVDHITPHRLKEAIDSGDRDLITLARQLFEDQDNWQPLCKPCHDSWKQALEKGREAWGSDGSGMPTSPAHHWNR